MMGLSMAYQRQDLTADLFQLVGVGGFQAPVLGRPGEGIDYREHRVAGFQIVGLLNQFRLVLGQTEPLSE